MSENASATLDAVAGSPAVGSEPVGTMELDFHGVDEFWSRRPESWRHAVDAISGRETWISSDPSEALKARLTALGEGFSCNASELSSWSQRPGWLAALRALLVHLKAPYRFRLLFWLLGQRESDLDERRLSVLRDWNHAFGRRLLADPDSDDRVVADDPVNRASLVKSLEYLRSMQLLQEMFSAEALEAILDAVHRAKTQQGETMA